MDAVAEPPHFSAEIADVVDAPVVAFPDASDIERINTIREIWKRFLTIHEVRQLARIGQVRAQRPDQGPNIRVPAGVRQLERIAKGEFLSSSGSCPAGGIRAPCTRT